jgi:hypothetical protein
MDRNMQGYVMMMMIIIIIIITIIKFSEYSNLLWAERAVIDFRQTQDFSSTLRRTAVLNHAYLMVTRGKSCGAWSSSLTSSFFRG